VTAGKVAEMEALFEEKQVTAGLTPADLLAPLLASNRSAQGDFQLPRFLRTKRDRASVRPEEAGLEAAANNSWGTPLNPWEIGWNAQRFTEERLNLQAVRRAFRCYIWSYADTTCHCRCNHAATPRSSSRWWWRLFPGYTRLPGGRLP